MPRINVVARVQRGKFGHTYCIERSKGKLTALTTNFSRWGI